MKPQRGEVTFDLSFAALRLEALRIDVQGRCPRLDYDAPSVHR
jgi:hypothetical protein